MRRGLWGGMARGGVRRRAGWKRARGRAVVRGVLLGASVVGVAVSAALWAAGHGGWAARVLTGDVVVLFGAVLVLARRGR